MRERERASYLIVLQMELVALRNLVEYTQEGYFQVIYQAFLDKALNKSVCKLCVERRERVHSFNQDGLGDISTCSFYISEEG